MCALFVFVLSRCDLIAMDESVRSVSRNGVLLFPDFPLVLPFVRNLAVAVVVADIEVIVHQVVHFVVLEFWMVVF